MLTSQVSRSRRSLPKVSPAVSAYLIGILIDSSSPLSALLHHLNDESLQEIAAEFVALPHDTEQDDVALESTIISRLTSVLNDSLSSLRSGGNCSLLFPIC